MRKILIPNKKEVNIGSFIKKLRLKYGFSQNDLCLRVGLSRPTLIKIENNKGDISVKQAKKLADLFNISLNDFFLQEDSSNNNIRDSLKSKSSIKNSVSKKEKNEKLLELIHLCWERLGGLSDFTEIELYSFIFLLDYLHIKKFNTPLFDLKYFKNNKGVLIENFFRINNILLDDKKLEIVNSKNYKFPNAKYLCLKVSKLEKISLSEYFLIEQLIYSLQFTGSEYVYNMLKNIERYTSVNDGELINIYPH